VTLVIAHRGASWERPENTIAAFERAIEVGADYVELDVHADGRGELVVTHDPPRGDAHPRLEEVLAAIAGRVGIMAELKTPYRYRRHDVVRRTEALLPEDAFVLSFEPDALREVRRLRTIQHLRPGGSLHRAAAHAWGVGLVDRAARPRTLARARALGLRTTVFTVNEEERMRRLVELAVDGIFTDRPDVLRRVLKPARSDP
jgi:glycerophosphoryl diester phosphodiesterase